MSIALMNIATQMTPRPHQRLSSTPSWAESAGEKWMKWGTSMAAYPARARSRTCATAAASFSARPVVERAGPNESILFTAELLISA
jgi:hypothetical protein